MDAVINQEAWSEEPLAGLSRVDCRELLWRDLSHTQFMSGDDVNFRCPHSIVGVGGATGA